MTFQAVVKLQLRGEPICTCCRLSEGSEQAFGHPVQDRVWDPLLTKHIPVRRLWPLSCSTTREAHRAPHSAGGCPLVSTATPASFSQQEQARDLENLHFVFIFSNLHLLPQLVLNMPGVKLPEARAIFGPHFVPCWVWGVLCHSHVALLNHPKAHGSAQCHR